MNTNVSSAHLQEILLVPLSHAVVDPRAVVVHPEDAAAADPAVVGSRRPIHFTPKQSEVEIRTPRRLRSRIELAGGHLIIRGLNESYDTKVSKILTRPEHQKGIKPNKPYPGLCFHYHNACSRLSKLSVLWPTD